MGSGSINVLPVGRGDTRNRFAILTAAARRNWIYPMREIFRLVHVRAVWVPAAGARQGAETTPSVNRHTSSIPWLGVVRNSCMSTSREGINARLAAAVRAAVHHLHGFDCSDGALRRAGLCSVRPRAVPVGLHRALWRLVGTGHVGSAANATLCSPQLSDHGASA